jgi:hypothetical protein
VKIMRDRTPKGFARSVSSEAPAAPARRWG